MKNNIITPLTGYELIEAIYESVNTVIYRGIREPERTSVIIKTLKADYPTIQSLTQLRHEYNILQSLNIEGIVKPYSLETYQNGLALILEDFHGESLKKFLETQALELKDFLRIAIQLTSILGDLHKNCIIHKDIKPNNIIINKNKNKNQIKIIDFSIATRLSGETPQLNNPNFLEGTLTYMSPEQTGRMNRLVDYRTDFYSLGVTFYEMLTGRLPFQSTDPLELVHCHIAKMPASPYQLNAEIPKAISEIVMKLLAKNAEDRYQTALGLKVDLETCLNQLETAGSITNFIAGQRDQSGQFLIPQKLYGRDAEIATLMSAFFRVASPQESQTGAELENYGWQKYTTSFQNKLVKSKSEMMLISGYSGIGKSSLVNEVHKPIVGAKGYFISGKFDQFKRNIPYACLIQAFQELMRQLLTESDHKIAVWKSKIEEAVAANGQVIIDVIPEVERIIGPQPQVPQLGPSESQNRFNRVFQEFIHVFCQPEHPLVVFLDDLQWADLPSLKLIELIITDSDSQYLLLIGAYRDNEVSATHPLIHTLEQIQSSGATVNRIILQALDIVHVNQLVADTLRTYTEKTKSLTELVFKKTQGNPFFLTQLLKSLYYDNQLTFDFNQGCWLWNIDLLQSIHITDNVIDLMVNQIQKLSPPAQEVLKLAACIGDKFTLDVLAIINEKSQHETAKDLWEALQADLVIPLNNSYKIPLVIESTASLEKPSEKFTASYKFLHDRVQQASYSLIPDSLKKQTHLKIGELLIKHTPINEIEENIFEIVNQLNIGSELITDQRHKDELAQLNLIAGKKAKAATAYETAIKYLRTGLEFLATDSWNQQYELTLELYLATIEVEYFNTNYQEAKRLIDIALTQANTVIDRAKIYAQRMNFHASQGELLASVETGLQALAMLGFSLPTNPEEITKLCETLRLELKLESSKIAGLINLPLMTDPVKLAAIQTLISLMPPVFLSKPELLAPVILTGVSISVKHGNAAPSAYAYCLYGLLLSGPFDDIESGYEFGCLALKVLDKFPSDPIRCQVFKVFGSNIKFWKESIRESLKNLKISIQAGIETSNIEYLGYGCSEYCIYLFFTGENLEAVDSQYGPYQELLEKSKQEMAIFYLMVGRQLVLNFTEPSAKPYCLSGETFQEETIDYLTHVKPNKVVTFCFYTFQLILCCFFRKLDEAVLNADLSLNHIEGGTATLFLAQQNFYHSLALLGKNYGTSKSNQEEALRLVNLNQEKLQQWAFHAASNFQHKYDLVEAEKARFLGKILEAMELYDRAITGAREQGFTHEEALANELATEFYLALGKEKIAQVYITDAYYGYLRWGGQAKVEDLEERYPKLLRISQRETLSRESSLTKSLTTTGSSQALDLATVMKASQVLFEEIVLDKLLTKLMKIVLENAGAETGFLILKKKGQLLIEAQGSENQDDVVVMQATPLENSHLVPISLINYVARTSNSVVLHNATSEGGFTRDTYIAKNKPKSVLCMPIINQGKLIGLLYLENNLIIGAFTSERLEILKLLSSQIAISLENANLYTNLSEASENLKKANLQLEDSNKTLEVRVKERTLELEEKNVRLKEQAKQLKLTLQELQTTQTQLIQNEKMSSLGQLVAGVAHEINNPVNFIYGNLVHANEYAQNLLQLIEVYQEEYPNPTPRVVEEIKATELEFLSEDLPKLLSSMKIGADRIRQIVLSLRNFSRLDEADMKPVDIHEGINNTLLILQHRLKDKAGHSAIQVIKEYGELPLVECYAGQLNQVFMNIITNAIDILDEPSVIESFSSQKGSEQRTIRIQTEAVENNCVVIRIKDNGPGMTEAVHRRLFDPFFTTKPVGAGTGLGLSISYQIVVEKHGGQLTCNSAPGKGAEFMITIPIVHPSQTTVAL